MDVHVCFGNRRIGPGSPVFVVAELSANHHHSFEQAVRLLHTAKEVGADAVKLQTYTPDTLTLDCDNRYFTITGTAWDGQRLHALYRQAYTPWEWQPKLKDMADELGMIFFSSPFDRTAVDFLENIGTPGYKIASFEIVDLPLLRQVARTGKPIILSTGMATEEEIEEALSTIRSAGGREIAILKCTSAYPASPREMNLRTIPHMIERFGIPVGLSDHSLTIAAPVAAVALGACIVEKHLTLSRQVAGPDSAFSLEPDEFRDMVQAVRAAEQSLGQVRLGPGTDEAASRIFRRSLFVVQKVRSGEPFTDANVRSIRPGHGLHTRHLGQILGRHAARDIERGTPLSWDLVGD